MGQSKGVDLLLSISGVGLRLYIGLMALVVAAIAVATVVVLVAPPSDVATRLASAPPFALPLIVVCAVIISGILTLGILFALQLLRIIATVKNGDPFEPANADRLTRMGWYALGATVAGWVVGGIAPIVEQQFKGMEISVSPTGGLALVITLFILARVFRHGAAMRDDLIGTV